MEKKSHTKSDSTNEVIHIPRKLLFIILLVLLIIIIVGGFLFSQWIERKNTAAFVDGEAITFAELDRVYDSTPLEYKLKLTKRAMLGKLIENEVLYQEAQNEGIAVRGAVADAVFKDFTIKNKLNETQLQKMFDTQGVTKKEAIINYARQYTIQKYLDERFYSTLKVSEEEIKKYYNDNPKNFVIEEMVTIRHILITDANTVESKAHAIKINEKITDSNFCEFVKTDSKDTSSIQHCGEYTFSRKDAFDDTFKKFSFEQAVGKWGIVETKFGYHIIWTIKKTPQRILSLDETHEKIKKYLLDEKANDAYNSFYNALANDYKIEILYEDETTNDSENNKINKLPKILLSLQQAAGYLPQNFCFAPAISN